MDGSLVNPNVKVSVLFQEYIETLKLSTSQSNWRPEESRGDNWILPAIGNKKINSLTEQNFQDILNLAQSKKRSKKTIKNIRATCAAFLKFCRRKHMTNMRLEEVSVPKGARNKKKSILQPADLEVLFSEDTSIKYGKRIIDEYVAAYRLQVIAGLRPGEIIGLLKSDITILPDKTIVDLSRSINANHEETEGKNETAIRRQVLKGLAKKIVDDQIVTNPETESLFNISNLQHYEKCLNRYCISNGITRVTPYELRHTFVSATKSLPEGLIKPIVGHTKDMDTYGVYSHEVEGDLELVAQKIDDVFHELIKNGL